MMSACPDCQAAMASEHHGFRGSCTGCCARAVSRGPHFFRVRQSGVQDRQYRALLERCGLSHNQVKAAAAADALQRVQDDLH